MSKWNLSLTEGVTGYWVGPEGHRCSVCFSKVRVLRLAFGYDVILLCVPCAVSMRELLIDALEDEDGETK